MTAKIEQLADYFQTLIGSKKEIELGEITPLLIKRYALAVGESNPLYFEKEIAQQYGYEDIIAPPNLLASVIEWDVGLDEEYLHLDGMPKQGFLPERFNGIKIMGGGEKKEFFSPLVAGMNVKLISQITDTYTRSGSKGLIAFLEETNTYQDENENILCVSKRTTMAR